MQASKRFLLRTYRWASLPYRRLWRFQAQRAGTVPISILYYHRVADDPNPWTISDAQFERHLDWLGRNFEIIDLAEVQRRIREGGSFRPSVSLTFDDGYAENCLRAIPLLLGRRIPFTYFVSWRNVRDQIPFAHDVLRGQPLAPNTVESIRALADAGVEIGSHALTHPNVAALNAEDLNREIVDSKHEIEAAIGRPVRYFAFPFGQHAHLSARAFEIGRQAGYAGLCSAYGGYNHVGGDPFHLQRLHGDPCLDYLKNWLDFDPRVGRTRRFNYQLESASVEAVRHPQDRAVSARTPHSKSYV